MGERILIVVRHAKSEWASGLPDFDRPLGDRGLRDAPAAGRWIADQGYPIEAVVISPSQRTRQTWELVAQAAGADDVDPALDRGIYEGEAEDLADALRGLPSGAKCAVIVGHSPGCKELVDLLTSGTGDPRAQATMQAKYPTSGVAVVRLSVPWDEIAAGCGELVDFEIPRG